MFGGAGTREGGRGFETFEDSGVFLFGFEHLLEGLAFGGFVFLDDGFEGVLNGVGELDEIVVVEEVVGALVELFGGVVEDVGHVGVLG